MIWVNIFVVAIIVMSLYIASVETYPEYTYYIYVEELEEKEEN